MLRSRLKRWPNGTLNADPYPDTRRFSNRLETAQKRSGAKFEFLFYFHEALLNACCEGRGTVSIMTLPE